ncbi:sirohydrochlorin chelatase [Thiocystis violacea]|uniref:sirohydrochlorin chelatase n=1 Tax=Thiocystis violacea TaxID=13725 RepID=UPI0019077A62|nr:CbiX/SirB N-terminal domain-containing protein [Thiocystis violacea]MBK1718406.1 cobalamin biosynthesis protein CbiX [Thiocystis violacea]
MRAVLLIDNGSKRPDSTLNLRTIADALSARSGELVRPVSLLHSDQVQAEQLAGQAADTFAPMLGRLLADGVRDLVLIPLFFGPSRALSQFVPETAATLAVEFGPFRLAIAPELCPLPQGEPRLVEILLDNLNVAATSAGIAPKRVILVDHGSPIPEVTAVRRWLGDRLALRLGPQVELEQAVMERRPGIEYDFNGPLLEDRLARLAETDPTTPILLSMLFLSAGRHAGPDGDIARIRARIEQGCPTLRLHTAPLVGLHPGLIEILESRLMEMSRWRRLTPGAD